jgi:hypothetical protein
MALRKQLSGISIIVNGGRPLSQAITRIIMSRCMEIGNKPPYQKLAGNGSLFCKGE